MSGIVDNRKEVPEAGHPNPGIFVHHHLVHAEGKPRSSRYAIDVPQDVVLRRDK